MKKILGLIMILVCLFSVAVFAEEADYVAEMNETGVNFTVSAPFSTTIGLVNFSDDGKVEDGICAVEGLYIAVTPDYYIELLEKDEISDEEKAYVRNAYAPLFYLLSVNGGRDYTALRDVLGDSLKEEDVIRLSTVDEYTFYLFIPEPADISSYGDEFTKEYETLRAAVPSLFDGAEYYEPVDPFAGIVGTKVAFTTTDINGNPVESADLFAANEITMINIWCSWCGPCVGELEELEAINAKLADINCGIIGLLYDGSSEDAVETAKGLIAEHGVTYTVVLPWDGLDDQLPVQAYPTSYFVDSEGTVVSAPIVGAAVDDYEPTIRALVAGEEVVVNNQDQDAVSNDAEAYRIYVSDENGNPVAGVVVQFCSDSTCMMGKTDENGLASYAVDPGTYTVHILKVPEGYEKDTNEYHMLDTYSDLSVVLTPAAK